MSPMAPRIKERLKNQMPVFFEKLRHTKSSLALQWCSRPVHSTGTRKNERKPRLIVSLTTYPARIHFVEQTIRSLFHQSLQADMVVLWLSEEQFPQKERCLPNTLLSLEKYGLAIEWCEDLKSYKKLIPSLQKYPNDIIVTADDDVIYWSKWLKTLYTGHRLHPTAVVSHRCHKMTFDQQGNIQPYLQWRVCNNNQPPSFSNFFVGCSGVLYPPNSLYEPDIHNKSLFTDIAPTADDVWFWAMSVLNRTPILSCQRRKTTFTENPYVNQCDSLMVVNHNNGNDKQLHNVLDHYPQLKSMLEEEWSKRRML